MSENFSTITALNPATITKAPTYTKTPKSQPTQTVASSPMDAYGYPQKKNNHWFLKSLAAVVVLGGAAAILRKNVDVFKNFDLTGKLAEDAKIVDKAKFYGTKAVAYVGEQINKGIDTLINWVTHRKDKVDTIV